MHRPRNCNLLWPFTKVFFFPDAFSLISRKDQTPGVAADQVQGLHQGQQAEDEWQTDFDAYAQAHAKQANELMRRCNGELPSDWQERVEAYIKKVNHDQ